MDENRTRKDIQNTITHSNKKTIKETLMEFVHNRRYEQLIRNNGE